MQKNIAMGNAVINAYQDNTSSTVTATSRIEKLQRHIRVLKRSIDSNDFDEDTIKEFSKELSECEQELSSLISSLN